MKRLLLFLLFPLIATAQGFSTINFSQDTAGSAPTQTGEFNSWYGFKGTGTDTAFGCTIGTAACDIHNINNSSGALTIVNQGSSVCGSMPPNSGGSSAKIFDYNTTLGNGVSSQYVIYNLPNTQSSTVLFAVWFCSNIPVTDNFGTTFDAVTLISSTSRISNYLSNGSAQSFALEGSSNSHPAYTPGNWVQLAFQFVNGGACSDLTNFTDCVRLCEYDINGTLIGCDFASAGAAAPANYITLGNLNAATLSSGHHVQFAGMRICTQGCTAAQFNSFVLNPVPPWDGIINNPYRGIDWTKSGISGGIPSGSWTQCGSTIAAYTGAASTINTQLAGCSANQYVLLGSGTFSLTGQISIPTGGKVELRGLGANSTFLTFSGSPTTCNQLASALCMKGSDGTFTTQPPPNTCTWDAGYAQGSTAVTFTNLAGTCLTAISTSTPTLLFMDQCNTGLSGSACGTGSETDNSQFYACSLQYTSTGPHGCSANGPDSGGARTKRDQLEVHTATAVNTGTGAVTLSPPVQLPNWASGQNPQVWIVQPAVNSGIKDLSIDPSGYSSGAACIDMFNIYKFWIVGVRCITPNNRAFNCLQCVNGIMQSNYIYKTTGSPPSQYGIRLSASVSNVIQNNILQQVLSPIFQDGAASANVIAYNYIINDVNPGNTLSPAITAHAGNYGDLIEGNASNQFSCDDVHGTCDMEATFRNFFTGWESVPSTPLTTYTNAISIWSFARYSNQAGNVLGTPGYHTGYSATSNNSFVYWMGGCVSGSCSGAGVPSDSLSKSTSVLWASYDTFTAANRFCGNALDTNWAAALNCNNTSEAANTASTYPGYVPVKGDTAIGQDVMPASFYLGASRPAWWNNSISYPAVGPDVSSGNVGQCSGTLNTVGQFNGTAALTNAQCGNHGITASSWGGHVNAIPAMACALNTMGMPPDGTGSALAFDEVGCYSAGGSCPLPGMAPSGGTYSGTITVTLTDSCTTIIYTTNGSVPTESSCSPTNGTVYTTPLVFTITTTLKAIACQASFTTSGVTSQTYTIVPASLSAPSVMFTKSGKTILTGEVITR